MVVKDFYQTVSGNHFRQLLSSLTGLTISAVSDVFGDIYKEGMATAWCVLTLAGSHNLCHNTGMASKRIAFFLFLSADDWKAEDGGTLDFFGNNQKFQPESVVQKIQPKANTLVIFEATPNTFFQVSNFYAPTLTERCPKSSQRIRN